MRKIFVPRLYQIFSNQKKSRKKFNKDPIQNTIRGGFGTKVMRNDISHNFNISIIHNYQSLFNYQTPNHYEFQTLKSLKIPPPPFLKLGQFC